MDVRLVCEREPASSGARYVVEVVSDRGRGTVGTFDEPDPAKAERLARACAIRVASSLRCSLTRS